ncbi:D-alanine--D-alanine ligase [Candidatus Mycobacterium wuenschmannii]|uniref:D-alanine--D-alanine ligase n=1 Tax=Candidatus Mycobacterium wuenschmannii TaxID=3027808 RepID=A0ABY8VZE5_9MYCO|nr:D-alanine--D-alanine ligase [Candidatus Mycobacterium wuenschmannii]WIM89000.1 D-alanine--D-alanine ligase [Candidatus Mycobacterium wuenschmannii]
MRLLHLVGSAVDGFHADLSRLYAGACLDALGGHVSHIAYVSPDGSWRFPTSLSGEAIAKADAMSLAGALGHIRTLETDAVIPQMFCLPGMTTYRALFDKIGIPYLGNSADVMAVAADKFMTRCSVAAAGVAVPEAEVLGRGERPALPYPVVVKPVCADNSVGVSLARDAGEYDAAAARALRHGNAVLVEAYVELGREVRCGIIVRNGELICLPLEEYAVDTHHKPIRTRTDKLARTADGDLYLVAKDETRAWIVPEYDDITRRVWEVARRCHGALGCRHYSLFDFRIDPDGEPWFLEAGLYCSYSPSSVLAVMAAARGIGVRQLLDIGLAELKREGARCLTSPR